MVITAAWDQNVMCCWVPPSRRWSSFSGMSTAFSATTRRTTSRIPAGLFFEPWSNNDDAKGVSGLLPPSLQEQQPPEGGDGSGPLSNSGEEECPCWLQLRLRREDAGVSSTCGQRRPRRSTGRSRWDRTASHHATAAAAEAAAARCAGGARGRRGETCSVCLSQLVDGEKVRVLTACMHYFHATCVEAWLHRKANCPVCRTPAMVVAV
ncbi:hypothetical protein BDA96_05G245100 [Sorghum bicolor]|uniref:RING-type domain-containing protein n=2 Tax=Sorghum bicolor TaxID=4558 RepID=A0A1B6PU66_SORBI|nr:hypothetical protein BDA96_05G245100 [Sorghum bicolor]KXG29212.1 hypothetical protein SORBI_3005G227600 [Sorghum bicolor]